MPRQVLPDEKAFADFKGIMLAWGYKELTNEEFAKAFQRSGLKPPDSSLGRETAFVYRTDRTDGTGKRNDLEAFVWTTYLSWKEEPKDPKTFWKRGFRDEDAGWILITQDGRARYFAHPLMRTKNFLTNLARLAWIARWRVANRPVCPQCSDKRYMRIAYGWAVKSRYWRCDSKNHHHPYKSVFLPWDFGMPPKALAFLKKKRKVRRKYRDQRTRAGKPNNVAMKKRTKWKSYRRENSA